MTREVDSDRFVKEMAGALIVVKNHIQFAPPRVRDGLHGALQTALQTVTLATETVWDDNAAIVNYAKQILEGEPNLMHGNWRERPRGTYQSQKPGVDGSIKISAPDSLNPCMHLTARLDRPGSANAADAISEAITVAQRRRAKGADLFLSQAIGTGCKRELALLLLSPSLTRETLEDSIRKDPKAWARLAGSYFPKSLLAHFDGLSTGT